ncbi:MAG: hypothetical protein ACTSPM_10285 [Candidatus Heimdallarchaeota archaeon]
MAKIKQLIHNGIMISDIPHLGLTIGLKDTRIELDLMQEQMAIAWVRKLSTVYVDDPVFCKNFFADFSIKLGHRNLTDEDIDFSEVIEYIETERAKRESLTKEQKKQKREERKVVRLKLKEYYGTAYLDGMKVDIGAWTAEPSSIFMGRGEHPMRGKWKEGPSSKDIILNLNKIPEPMNEEDWKDIDWRPKPFNKEDWKEIVWESECLWVAKWEDKLSQRTKYVWLSDNTPLKQDREIEKFNKAKKISKHLEKIRSEIVNGIKSDNPRTRKIALACYIIDQLILRVGDEKDEDEADTVGATTLRPEHITIEGENVNFNFLGKDSVEWNKDTTFPPYVIKELQFLIAEAEKSGEDKPQIFSKIGSTQVNDFFSNIVPDLTAKVFRTFHATNIVSAHLEESDTSADDPEYKKKEAATMANREAAVVCTHMKQVPKNWDNRIQRFRERKIKSTERIEKAKLNQGVREERLDVLKTNLKERRKQEKGQQKILALTKTDLIELDDLSNSEQDSKEKEKLNKASAKQKKKVQTQRKRVGTAKKRIESAQNQLARGKNSVGTAKERVYKAREAYKKIESQERISKSTKVWNLGTSLKSYIDPRVYHAWGKEVDYDWRNYYSKTLQNKFSWVERDEE